MKMEGKNNVYLVQTRTMWVEEEAAQLEPQWSGEVLQVLSEPSDSTIRPNFLG
jgi:hypothetical protein